MLSRRVFTRLVGLGAASPWPVLPSASPVEIGSDAQLFVDRVLVRETRDVAFRLHPAGKHPANPLIRADRPWEGWRVMLFGSVIYDQQEKLFKMWYNAEPVGYFGPPPDGPSSDGPMCYAVSHDGLHWEKPLVGTLPAVDGSRHNAVSYGTDLASVYKDAADPDPARRYKMICYAHTPRVARGYQTKVSPDGIHWTLSSAAPICPGGDVINGYYDERRKLYVATAKIMTVVRGHQRRVFYVTTSADFATWSKPELVFSPDLEDDAGSLARIEQVRPILDRPDDPALMRTEFYGVGFYPAESCTLAFPWIFTINNRARYGNEEGPFEIQLAVSRELNHWQRPFRVPVIPRGNLGDWECGIQITASRALRVGDEIWLYYSGANYTHGTPVLYRKDDPGRKGKYTSSIGLAKWKLDRFVSADGLSKGGTLTTVPVSYSGRRLEINADIRNGGEARVELLDAAGRPLAISRPLHGDDLRHAVRWPAENVVSAWRGKPVSLRFHLREAALFSFAFRDMYH
jgi:hypothetical protein